MPRYKYSAVSLSGETTSGEYSAPDADSVIGMLRSGGYYPLDVLMVAGDVDRVTRRKVRTKPLAGLCQQTSAMLKSGVPVLKTLELLKEQTEDDTLRKILGDVFVKVQRGESLYDSFSTYEENFPSIFLNMVEAGEESGMLDVCMSRTGAVFSRNARLGGKLRSAMIYPLILLALMSGVVTLLMAFVIPSFVTMFEQNNAELPMLTRALVAMSGFFTSYWYALAFLFFAAVASFVMWISSEKGRLAFDRFKLRIPVVKKLLIKVYAARYARTLSSLCAAGVQLPSALAVTARSLGNRYIEKDLYKVAEEVSRGIELSALIDRLDSIPPMIVYLTRLGEESGTMNELLSQAADFYDDEADSALQTLTAMLEPLMIVLMAIIVLPVILAIILPVFNMYSFVV